MNKEKPKMKSKIIIHNYTKFSDFEVIKYVVQVIENGKISNDEKNYCYLTIFKDNIAVIAEKQNKKETYTFKVYKEC